MGADYSSVFEHVPHRGVLIRRAGCGWPSESVGSEGAVALLTMACAPGYTLLTGHPAVTEDAAREQRFAISPYAAQHGGKATATVIIAREVTAAGPPPAPFGVLGVVFRQPRAFSKEDLDFLQAVANIVATAICRQQAEAELRGARKEAERANRAKSEFLSRMSHELRTPLNAILGFAQLLALEIKNKRHRASVDYILKGGHHLLGLINEVLDLARIESGQLQMALVPLDAGDLVRECLCLIDRLAVEARVVCAIDQCFPRARLILADRQRASQVLLNLISNAVKYNRPGGRVTVSGEETSEGRLRIMVADTGPGIAPVDLERLFVPFQRLGQERGTKEGTGLGLVVSLRLTEAMAGRLGVESRVGGGSTFWIELPLFTMPNSMIDCPPAMFAPPGPVPPPPASCISRIIYPI